MEIRLHMKNGNIIKNLWITNSFNGLILILFNCKAFIMMELEFLIIDFKFLKYVFFIHNINFLKEISKRGIIFFIHNYGTCTKNYAFIG